MEDVVLSYEKLKDHLNESEKGREMVLANLKEISADYRPNVIKGTKTFLDYSFKKLYQGMNFECPPEIDLNLLIKNNCVVFVPNHQSHADYIALAYALYTKLESPVFIAGGINLDIFPVGTMFRSCGCFFIRRSFNNDVIYKLTLEAYLYYLLKSGYPVEFFFEGGRSRSGKLLPPKYGLFQMLLEAHKYLKEVDKIDRSLMFVPVSIVHEFLPELKSHLREMAGKKKVKENPLQLLNIFKMLNQNLGTIHIKVNKVIEFNKFNGNKEQVQKLAFDCFRIVGSGMVVTPISLLALILLGEPSGALTYEQIIKRSEQIIEYCQNLNLPLADSLKRGLFEEPIKKALNGLKNKKQVKLIENPKLGRTFYFIEEQARIELLYYKNTILHHFLVPCFINTIWLNLFQGNIKTVSDLKRAFLKQRKKLKYEFYLPTIKELLYKSFDVVSYGTGRKIRSLEECLTLSSNELYNLGDKVGIFSRAFSYIYEAYYLSALAIKHLMHEQFTKAQFLKIVEEMFELEKAHGRLIKYRESFSLSLVNSSLEYFSNQKVLGENEGKYFVLSPESGAGAVKLEEIIEDFARDLSELLTFNFRLTKKSPT